MIEFQDSRGRLIVVFRVGRTKFCVFVDGKCEGVFRSGSEAVEYARSLLERADNKPGQ